MPKINNPFIILKSSGGDDGTAKGLADGSLTSFSAPALGVTSLAYQRFRNFTSLQSLDLTGVTDIPEYSAYGCTGLTSLTIDPNTTNIGQYAFYNCNNNRLTIDLEMNGSVGAGAFYNSKIRSVKGIYSALGREAFFYINNSDSRLNEINITVNGYIGGSAFGNCANVSNFTLSQASNVTELGGSAFYCFGARRTNPSTNQFNIDFRSSTFTYVPEGCFTGEGSVKPQYMNIYFPSTVTIINNYNFYSTDHLNMYYKNVPTLNNTSAFNRATNFKNFFPYNLVQTAKTSTNWSSSTYNIVSSIYGYAEENTFSLGDTLPDIDADGYALTWYSDVEMTQQVTTVTDPTQIYYCAVGSRVKVPLSITQYQATCAVSDGMNTYNNGDWVSVGTTLTITGVGQGANTQVYLFTLNGTNISSGDTYVVTSSSIEIKCIYWDGQTQPILSNFADNTWDQIATAISFGLHRTMWPISSGSTVSKPITLTDGTITNLRLADSTANRYEFSDGSGYSQAVLEMDMCIPTTYAMNTTATNIGGWPATYMCNTVMPIVYDMLPSDLKSLVKEVKVPSATSYKDGTLVYANNKCFLAAASEVYNSYNVYAYNEGAIFGYYDSTANSAKMKQRSGLDGRWYLRSPRKHSYDGGSTYVRETGAYDYSTSMNSSWGVSVCLVIG